MANSISMRILSWTLVLGLLVGVGACDSGDDEEAPPDNGGGSSGRGSDPDRDGGGDEDAPDGGGPGDVDDAGPGGGGKAGSGGGSKAGNGGGGDEGGTSGGGGDEGGKSGGGGGEGADRSCEDEDPPTTTAGFLNRDCGSDCEPFDDEDRIEYPGFDPDDELEDLPDP